MAIARFLSKIANIDSTELVLITPLLSPTGVLLVMWWAFYHTRIMSVPCCKKVKNFAAQTSVFI